LTALIEGRLSTASAKDELIKLASRLIVEEALEGEAGDALGREYYEHAVQQPGVGRDNGAAKLQRSGEGQNQAGEDPIPPPPLRSPKHAIKKQA
jgi:hypothetical protein